MASCPHCKARIHEVRLQGAAAKPRDPERPQKYALLYCCPNCDVVLGAGPDQWNESRGFMARARPIGPEPLDDDAPDDEGPADNGAPRQPGDGG
jgi:hypothetical protein